jgi:hypothetical protein
MIELTKEEKEALILVINLAPFGEDYLNNAAAKVGSNITDYSNEFQTARNVLTRVFGIPQGD